MNEDSESFRVIFGSRSYLLSQEMAEMEESQPFQSFLAQDPNKAILVNGQDDQDPCAIHSVHEEEHRGVVTFDQNFPTRMEVSGVIARLSSRNNFAVQTQEEVESEDEFRCIWIITMFATSFFIIITLLVIILTFHYIVVTQALPSTTDWTNNGSFVSQDPISQHES